MSEAIVPRETMEVKPEECSYEECHEDVFQEGLCWEHFNEEKIAEWDAQDAERQAAREGVGYILGDPVDRDWYGYPKEALR